MRKTKGTLNGKEFIKIKPDLPESHIRGIVTAELIDSESGEIVESCQSENIITDSFYRNAVAFFAEDFINGRRSANSGEYAYLGSSRSSSSFRAHSFGILTLVKNDLPESENIQYIEGEIAGTAVVSNNVSRAETWAGNLRNPQDHPILDENRNVHYSRKFEFTEAKLIDRPFNTLYWQPSFMNSSDTNLARLITASFISYDNSQPTRIDGAGSFSATQVASTRQPPPISVQTPEGVTVQQWGNFWTDLQYRYLRGFLTAKSNSTSLVVAKFDVNTAKMVELKEFTITSANFNSTYGGRTYCGFLAYGIHPITGTSNQRYVVRCNYVTGEIAVSAHCTSYPQSNNAVFNEDGNVRTGTSLIDFETGTVTTMNTADIEIPQWLYPTSGIRPTVGTITAGVDTFDVALSNTHFGTVIATFDYDMKYKMLQNEAGIRYKGVAMSTSGYAKTILAPPTVMYKFPKEIVKNDKQVLVITYELVIPSDIIDVTKKFMW